MQTPKTEPPNFDVQCFEHAFYEWNRQKTGSDNTGLHLPWWKLSPAEQSEIMLLAQRFKREALEAQEVAR